jgi:hypothetical protein
VAGIEEEVNMQNEWRFQTSRRGLLRFLSGATLVGGTAVSAKALPNPTEGIVQLVTPATASEVPAWDERSTVHHLRNGYMDIVPWRLYDTHRLGPTGGGRLSFFGSTLLTRNSVETNMRMANRLPAPQSFQIRRLWLLLMGNRNAAELFVSGASLELIIGQKIYSHISAMDVSRYGLEEVSLRTEPGPRCMDFTAAPLTIGVQQYFSAHIDYCTLPSQLVIQCILDGLLDRGIQ